MNDPTPPRMTDQAPELLPCPFCGDDKIMIKPRSCTGVPSYYQAECDECGATSHGSFHLDKIGAAKEWNTRPTPAERPVAQVREMRWLEHAKSTQCCDPIIDGLISGAIEIISALTARPSDAAVAWQRRYKASLVASWETIPDERAHMRHDMERQGWEIRPLFALLPDEPARESGLTIEHRLQAVRETAIEECTKIAEAQARQWVNGSASTVIGQSYQRGCNDAANAVRALEPARVTPSTEDDTDHMWKIGKLIADLQSVLDRFGDTCVYIRRGGLSWGAVALNRRADDEKHGVFDLQAQHDRDMQERLGQIERLKKDRDEWRQKVWDATPSTVGGEVREKALRGEIWCLREVVRGVRVMNNLGAFTDFEGEPWLKRVNNIDLDYDPCAAQSPTIASEKECGKAVGEDR